MSLISQHQHVRFIKQLSTNLNSVLQKATFKGAFTTSKNELFLEFHTHVNTILNIHFKIDFQTCFIFFNDHELHKRSNTRPLFIDLKDKNILIVANHKNNRSFEMHFNETETLIFKMYDGLSNILYYKNDKVKEMFRDNIKNDWKLTKNDFVNRQIEQTKSDGMIECFSIVKTFENNRLPYLMLLEKYENGWNTNDIFEAYNIFSKLNIHSLQFIQKQKELLHQLNQKLTSSKKHISHALARLDTIRNEPSPEEIGHIIMANLHLIQKGDTSITLPDFYRNKPITIKLKKDLNSQDNAAYYYRKYKNRNLEVTLLNKQIKSYQALIDDLENKLEIVRSATDIKSLKPFEKEAINKQSNTSPFKIFNVHDFEIWVGKNASNNDLLTLKHAHKNDTWLHAKDVSGSHVVIKHKPGKMIPVEVLQKAAEIAAYYSKLKGSKWVPVTHTLKKFVRKPKGFEPGQVAVDKEEIIMVEPKLPDTDLV